MKIVLAMLSLFLAIPFSARAGTNSTDAPVPTTTVRFSEVVEEGYPGSKEMALKARQASFKSETLTVMNDAIITEEDIQKAKAVASDNGTFAIVLTLTPAGVSQLNADTKDMMGKRLAIIIDGTLVSAPVLRSTTFGSIVQISGNFTEAQADKIAQDLSSH